MDAIGQRLRAAVVATFRRRATAGLIVGLLALGIGTSAAMFAVVRGVLLRPLPYPAQEQLLWISESLPAQDLTNVGVSFPRFEMYEAGNRSLAGIGAFWKQDFTLTGSGTPARLPGARVSAGLFATLGVAPIAGRVFSKEEQVAGGPLVAMIGERLWRTTYGGARDVVGRVINVDGLPCTVIGIMPSTFTEPLGDVDVWMPRVSEPDLLPPPAVLGGAGYLGVVGRLRPDATVARATADLRRIAADYRARSGDMRDAPFDPAPVLLSENLTVDLRDSIVLLWAAGTFVFLIACANAGNLLLTRALSRRTEFGVRAALGASPRQLVQLLLAECVVLAAASIALGLVLAAVALRLVGRLATEVLPSTRPPAFDPAVFAFAALLGVVAVLVTGLAPALRITSGREGGLVSLTQRGTTAGRGASRWRRALVVAQVAVSFVLLAGALQQATELLALQRMDRGFDPQGVLTLQIAPSSPRFAAPPARLALYQQITERLAALPGVRAAGAAQALPVGEDQLTSFVAEAQRAVAVEERPKAQFRIVTPGYLEALGVTLVRGRTIAARDAADAVPAVVVSASLAQKYLGGTDVVGRRVFVGGNPNAPPREIIGVVADVRSRWATSEADPAIYVPAAQMPIRLPPMAFLVRGQAAGLDALPAAVRAQVSAVAPEQAVTRMQPMHAVFDRGLAVPRLRALLMMLFGVLGTVLACVGVWAVMSQLVLERSRDIGIRVALGATRGAIVGLIVRTGLALSAAGLALGVVASLVVTRLLAGILPGIGAPDVTVLVGAGVLLFAIGCAAAYLPARRATRIAPFAVLGR